MAEAGAKARVGVLISGRGSNMAALLYASRAADSPYEIVLVAADNPDAPGLRLAEAEGVRAVGLPRPTAKDKAQFFEALDGLLRDADVHYVALAGFMRILPDNFVHAWQGRMLNIHPSLLPLYKGLDTHAKALAAGDSHAGCSVHLVTPELDSGEVLAQTRVAILPGDTAETLAERVLIAEHALYAPTLAAYVSRERDPDWIVTKVDSLARALPEVDQRSSHGAPGWRVGGEKAGKFFAYVSIHHHGEDAIALLVKTSGQDEMTALIDAEPDLYYRAAYYGASGWIAIRLDSGRVDWDHVSEWLGRSWRAVAPKKLTKLMDAADAF